MNFSITPKVVFGFLGAIIALSLLFSFYLFNSAGKQ